jgi:hypothetical protein
LGRKSWWLRPVLSIPRPGQNWPLQYLGQEELVAEASPIHLEAGPELAFVVQVDIVAKKAHWGEYFALVSYKQNSSLKNFKPAIQ